MFIEWASASKQINRKLAQWDIFEEFEIQICKSGIFLIYFNKRSPFQIRLYHFTATFSP